MRIQIITTLRRLGKRAGFLVDTLNNRVPVKWNKDGGVLTDPAEYAFQIGDGVARFNVDRLLECDVNNRIFLVMSYNQSFLDKVVKDLYKNYDPETVALIKFISVKDFRTSMETSLSKVIFGTAVLGSKPIPNLKQPGSMPGAQSKCGLIITKIGKDFNYNTRNPAADVFVWYLSDDTTKVLEAVVGSGFSFSNIRKLNNSAAKKKIYIAVKLYGDKYKEATDKILKVFPNTMIEFISVAEVQTTKDLEALFRKRLVVDMEANKTELVEPKNDLFKDW